MLLFGIATSIENFVERLPPSVAQVLECRIFDIARADDLFEELFCATISRNNGPLWLGPTICDLLIQRQKDFIQPTNSIDIFIRVCFLWFLILAERLTTLSMLICVTSMPIFSASFYLRN